MTEFRIHSHMCNLCYVHVQVYEVCMKEEMQDELTLSSGISTIYALLVATILLDVHIYITYIVPNLVKHWYQIGNWYQSLSSSIIISYF